ncbi:MAG TPA: cytochrome P450, partial [Ilumatobacteraceae bacterium]|nr:cytochrome P450 [Ilumatobacteraceae bacterium]
VISDCLLLLDGGAETTRTVIARTLLNLIEFPDQWQRLLDGVDMAAATEEFVRYVTPVHNMCRTATQDYEIGGVTIRKGQQVVLMYASANRDESHFTDPERFDVTRPSQQNLAFGFGTHFCLGRSLALLEIRRFFEELIKRVKGLKLVEGTAPVEMANAFVFGLKEAHIQFDLR